MSAKFRRGQLAHSQLTMWSQQVGQNDKNRLLNEALFTVWVDDATKRSVLEVKVE